MSWYGLRISIQCKMGFLITADQIFRQYNVTNDLYIFLKDLPGLHFVDGFYICSELGDDATENLGPFGKATMLKFRAWTLTMYHRVLQYDHDQFLITPYGFDRMFSIFDMQDEEERYLLNEQEAVGVIGGVNR